MWTTLLAAALPAGGCASYHARPAPWRTILADERPESIRVTVRDGHTLDLREPKVRVDATGDTVLVGTVFDARRGRAEAVAVPARDVAAVAVRAPDHGRNIALVVGVGGALTALYLFLQSLAD